MLLAESIVKVAMVDFSSGRLYLAVMTSITPVGSKGKANLPDSGENLSKDRNRALESPGRAWR